MILRRWPLGLLLIASALAAVDPVPHIVNIQNGFIAQDVTLNMEFLFSTGSNPSVVAARSDWAALKHPVLQERVPGDRLWLRLRIANQSGHNQRLVLATGEARTDSVHYFLIQKGSIRRELSAGDLMNRAARPAYLAAYFPLELAAAAEAQIFMWIENPVDLAADVTLVRADLFAEWGGFNYLLQGGFFGALMVLLLYYGAIYLSRRTRTVAAYFWYLAAAGVFFAARTGLLYQIFAYPQGQLMNVLTTPLSGLIYAAGIRFTRTFLELQKASWQDRTLRIAQYVSLLPLPVAFLSRTVSREICDWLTLILGPGLLVFVWIIRDKSPKAPLFLMGWCWPIIASLLQYTGGDSSYMMRNVLLQASMLIEFVFFAFFVGRDISKVSRDSNAQRVHLLMLQEDLEQARRVHETLLPSRPPQVRGLAVQRLYRPMSELGGDYYDWFKLSDQQVVILVADVTGHGLPAALDAAAVHIAFQSAVVEANSSSTILEIMNAKLIGQNIDRCVSAVCALYDADSQTVEVSLAGHPQAIVITAGKPLCLGEHAPLLGFSADSKYTSVSKELHSGDRLFLFTDGAYENPESQLVDEFAEFADQLAAMSRLALEPALAATIEHFDRLRQYRHTDDVTLLGAEVHSHTT